MHICLSSCIGNKYYLYVCHLGWRTLVLKCNKNNYDYLYMWTYITLEHIHLHITHKCNLEIYTKPYIYIYTCQYVLSRCDMYDHNDSCNQGLFMCIKPQCEFVTCILPICIYLKSSKMAHLVITKIISFSRDIYVTISKIKAWSFTKHQYGYDLVAYIKPAFMLPILIYMQITSILSILGNLH